ncbi:hypothetical protein B1218_38920, partial [Pseudomonas ogarae]
SLGLQLRYVRSAVFGQALPVRARLAAWEHRPPINHLISDAATRQPHAASRPSGGPRRRSNAHPLASVSGATNAVAFTSELRGAMTVSGPGAGRTETAFALLS